MEEKAVMPMKIFHIISETKKKKRSTTSSGGCLWAPPHEQIIRLHNERGKNRMKTSQLL